MRIHSPLRRLQRERLLPLLLVLGVAGCEAAGHHEPDGADPAPAAGDTLPPDTAAAADSPSHPGPALALEGEGLRIFDPATGSARPLPFGTPSDQVLRVLELVHGAPPRDAGESADCGGRYATWEDGLSVRFRGDALVGWSVGRPGPTTAAGVGVGSTRRELESVHAATFARTSLGFEFSAGALAGVLEGEGEEARIRALWAGEACLAR